MIGRRRANKDKAHGPKRAYLRAQSSGASYLTNSPIKGDILRQFSNRLSIKDESCIPDIIETYEDLEHFGYYGQDALDALNNDKLLCIAYLFYRDQIPLEKLFLIDLKNVNDNQKIAKLKKLSDANQLTYSNFIHICFDDDINSIEKRRSIEKYREKILLDENIVNILFEWSALVPKRKIFNERDIAKFRASITIENESNKNKDALNAFENIINGKFYYVFCNCNVTITLKQFLIQAMVFINNLEDEIYQDSRKKLIEGLYYAQRVYEKDLKDNKVDPDARHLQRPDMFSIIISSLKEIHEVFKKSSSNNLSCARIDIDKAIQQYVNNKIIKLSPDEQTPYIDNLKQRGLPDDEWNKIIKALAGRVFPNYPETFACSADFDTFLGHYRQEIDFRDVAVIITDKYKVIDAINKYQQEGLEKLKTSSYFFSSIFNDTRRGEQRAKIYLQLLRSMEKSEDYNLAIYALLASKDGDNLKRTVAAAFGMSVDNARSYFGKKIRHRIRKYNEDRYINMAEETRNKEEFRRKIEEVKNSPLRFSAIKREPIRLKKTDHRDIEALISAEIKEANRQVASIVKYANSDPDQIDTAYLKPSL